MLKSWLATATLAMGVAHAMVALPAGHPGLAVPGQAGSAVSGGAGSAVSGQAGSAVSGQAGFSVSDQVGLVAPDRVAAADETKYYIVGGAHDGQRETLFSIAAATLGNGNRYPEIVALNQDRIQPDGERLTDPLVVKPGWVLQLPPDATGPGVQVGPVPEFSAPATPPQRAAVPGDKGAVAAPVATPEPLSRLTFVVVAVVLVGLALVGLALLGRARLGRARRGWASLGRRREQADRFLEPVAAAILEPLAGKLLEPVGRSGPPPSVSEAEPPLARPATSSPSLPAARSAGLSALRRAEGTAVRLPSTLDTEVSEGVDSLAVSLSGQREPAESAVHKWVGPGELIGRDPGTIPAAVGIGPQGTLVVDLARAPDVITMTGPGDGLRRQARRLAEQLAGAGVRVSAAAGVLDEPVPFGIRVLPNLSCLPGLPDQTGFPGQSGFPGRMGGDAPAGLPPQVVFCPGDLGPSHEPESRSIRRMVSRRSPMVFVLVGSPRRSRWCIDVRPADR